MKNLFTAYSNEILSYSLGVETKTPSLPETSLSAHEVERHTRRLERLLAESGRKNLTIFGAGCPVLLERAAALCRSLERNLFVCELNLQRARQFRNSGGIYDIWSELDAEGGGFICDSSPRAVLALLSGAGIQIENSVFYLTPGFPERESKALQACMQLVQRSRLVFANEAPGFAPILTPDSCYNSPGSITANPTPNALSASAKKKPTGQLSVLAILHPEEPNLDEFCAQIPVGAKELVIVWDSPKQIKRPLFAACPIIQSNRDLAGDFAAQRNHALNLCSGSWVLALDGDERLDEEGWSEVLTAAAPPDPARRAGDIFSESNVPSTPDIHHISNALPTVNAYFLPRLTLFPDKQHFRAGFGLWPDYQMRLFRRAEKTFFIRPVHEILTGITRPSAILQHAPLWHLSYILKDRETLEDRLNVFNQALGRNAHRLSREYPHLPFDWFKAFLSMHPDLKYILLPE